MTMLLHFDENVPLPLLASCRHHAQANHVLQPWYKVLGSPINPPHVNLTLQRIKSKHFEMRYNIYCKNGAQSAAETKRN